MAYSNVTPPELPDYHAATHYLYNGVELPEIPPTKRFWDDREYPKIMLALRGTTYCTFYGWSGHFDYHDNETIFISGYCFYSRLDDSGWTTPVFWSGAGSEVPISCFFWANFDFSDDAGNVLLAASDPVPVSQYPYSIIAFSYEKGAEDWYQVHLWYSAAPFTWNGSAVVNNGTAYTQIYASVDGVTGWTGALETDVEATPGLGGTTYQRIWTNHDILDADGAVWLPAGEVTPVEETVSDLWLKSFKMGLALGLTGAPLPFKREPVAYLYNGVRLPKLPEWDKEAYPYAVLFKSPAETRLFFIEKYSYGSISGKRTLAFADSNILRYEPSGDKWTELETGNVSYLAFDYLVWSGFDLLNSDGTLYLAASDPVPVYE